MNGLRNISINTTILLRTNQKPLDRFGRAVFVYCGNVLNYTKNIYIKSVVWYNEIKESDIMKKAIAIILSICFLFSLCGCSKEKTKTTDYQYMYDGIVKDWNKAATPRL